MANEATLNVAYDHAIGRFVWTVSEGGRSLPVIDNGGLPADLGDLGRCGLITLDDNGSFYVDEIVLAAILTYPTETLREARYDRNP